jgi:hypothetical protein
MRLRAGRRQDDVRRHRERRHGLAGGQRLIQRSERLGPVRPSTPIPEANWKARTALRVAGPTMPSSSSLGLAPSRLRLF